jgi:WD40 repeat protein
LPINDYGNLVAFSPKGDSLAVSTAWQVIAWDAQNYDQLFSAKSVGGLSMDYSPDGSKIVTGISGATVHVLDAKDGELVASTGMAGGTEVIFGGDSRLVIILNEGQLWFWDIQIDEMVAVKDSNLWSFVGLAANADRTLFARRGCDDIAVYGVSIAQCAHNAICVQETAQTTLLAVRCRQAI